MSSIVSSTAGEYTPLLPDRGVKESLLSRIASFVRAVFSEKRPLYEGSLQPTLLAQDVATGTPATVGIEQAINPPHTVTSADQGIAGGLAFANGITTIAIGVLHGAKGKAMAEKAAETQDHIGAQIGFSRIARIPGDVTRGSATLIKGGATIAATAKATQIINVASKVAAGGSLVTATALMVMCGSYLHEARKIEQGLQNTTGTSREKVQYLQGLRELSKEEEKTIIQNFSEGKESGTFATRFAHKLFGAKDDDTTKALKAFLKNPQDENVKNRLKELFQNRASRSSDPLLGLNEDKPEYELVNNLVNNNFTSSIASEIKGELYRLCEETIRNERERKKDVFGRAVGSDAVKLLDSCKDIKNISQVEAMDIVKAAETGFTRTKGLMTLGIALSVLWIGVTIAAFVLTGGVSAIVEAVIGLVITLAAVGLDGYYLYQEFKEKKLVSKDKAFMFVMSLITAMAGALAVAAAKSIANRVTTGVISLVWLAFLLYCVWGRKSTEESAHAPVRETDSAYGSEDPVANPI